MRRNMLTHLILPSLRDEEYLEMGCGTVHGAVRVAPADSGAGQSSSAWRHCVRLDFVAGDCGGEVGAHFGKMRADRGEAQ